MSVTLTGNISPPLGPTPVTGDRSESRLDPNRSAERTGSLAAAPKGPRTDSPPGVIRAHPTAPTEDMLQGLRDREILDKRGKSTREIKTKGYQVESPPEPPKLSAARTPYDPDPEVSHSLDVVV